MKRNIHTILLAFNALLLMWCIYNVTLLKSIDTTESQFLIEKTPNASAKAIDIYKSYEKSEQIEKITEFMALFEKVNTHLEATKDVTLESIDALYEYTYAFLFIAIINIMGIIYLAKEKTHNKSVKRDK